MWWLEEGESVATGVPMDEACVAVLDLATIHRDARGFRKGFADLPLRGSHFGYLSPGQYDVAIRFDADDFGIHSTRALPLSSVKQEFGGYSGGFKGMLRSNLHRYILIFFFSCH